MLGLLSFVSTGAATAIPTAEGLLTESPRYPVIAVPMVPTAPVIDGTVGGDEWATASVIPDLIYDSQNTAQRCGTAAKHRSRYLLQYTADALFIAARYDVPAHAGGPAVSDISWANQDAVDVFLNPQAKFSGEKWHMSASADGKSFLRNLVATGNVYVENPKMEVKARIFPGGWEVEARFPFTTLETPAPVAGETWRANFVAVRRTPIPTVSAWSYWARWRQSALGSRDGWLVFTGKPLGVRFDHGANDVTLAGITIGLSGDAAKDGAEVVTQLYRRKENPLPQDPGIAAKLGEMVDNTKVGGSNTYGMELPAVARMVKQELDPVGQPVTKQLTAADKSVSVKAVELGEYLLEYKVVSGGDNKLVLAAGALPFRVEPPVSLAMNSFELEHGMRRFDVDYSTMAGMANAKKVNLVVSPEANGKPVESRSVETGKGFSQIEVPSKDWKPGRYAALAEIADASGKVLGTANTVFEKKPLPDWYAKPEGFEPEVPEPWKPVRVQVSGKKTAQVEVLGRTYTFAGSPVPASVLSTPAQLSKAEPPQKPVELLAGGIELAVTAGGQRVGWATKELKLESKKPSEIVLATEKVAQGLVLKAKTKVEFDGMIRVDLALGSEGAATKIEKFDLVIPYRGDVAELMSTYRKAPGPGGALKGRYLGKVPREPWKYSVYYTHFIGNNKVGLEWFCDSMKDWRVKKGDEAVEVVREGDRVKLTFHLVDHEVTLDKPLHITFGLIATPTKPVPLGWEILRFDQQAYLPPLPGDKLEGGKVATQADTDAWVNRMKYARVKVNLMFGWSWTGVEWFQYPVAARPELRDRLKKQFDIVHSTGAKMCPWGSWFCIPTSIPEWPLWGAEMVVQPMRSDLGKSFTACYNSPFTDFLVGNFASNARSVGIDGMRHDTIAPQVECQSEYHGCGWRDEYGNLQPSVNLFAAREYFKRLYRVFHGGVRKNGVCYFPLAGPPINAIDSFVDIHEIGEGNFEHGKTLKEGYPQEDVRVRHTGTAYGFVTSSNLKGQPLQAVERMAALFVAGSNPRLAFAGNPHYGYRGYQKIYQRTPNVVETWNAWKWIDVGNQSIWKPYWENADLLKLKVVGRVPSRGESPSPTPAEGSGPTTTKPETYGSFYYIPGKRVLLIVTNYEQEPLAGLVAKLDLKKLGFKGSETLYGEDAVTEEFVEVKDGAVSLDLFAQRYRMIKISADKPRLHPDNLGENVFAGGGFEGDRNFTVIVAPPGQATAFAEKDVSVKQGGTAALKLTKTEPVGNGNLELPSCPVAPGWYELSGWVRLDQDLKPTLENGTHPRPDYTFVSIGVSGVGVRYDPPAEFLGYAGTFQLAERTPGWLRFVKLFQATEQTKQVKVSALMYGVGTAWVDNIEIRPIKK